MNTTQPPKFVIKSLVLVQRPGYDQQFRRDYVADLTPETLQNGPAYPGFIGYSSTPEHSFVIPNGWESPRYSFILRAAYTNAFGGTTHVDVLGYTDKFVEPSLIEGSDMAYVVNSISMWREQIEQTPMGPGTYRVAVDHDHVYANPEFSGAYDSRQVYRQRPEDMYAALKLVSIAPTHDAIDVRSFLDGRPVASRRSSLLPSFYLDTILTNYMRAESDRSFGIMQEEDILENARGYVQENLLSSNPFFKMLSKHNDGLMKNSFTWADLTVVQEKVSDVTMIAALGETSSVPKFASWGSADIVSQKAWAIAMGVPALMSMLSISQLSFYATNALEESDKEVDPLTQVAVSVSEIESLMYENLEGLREELVQAFTRLFTRYLLRDVSMDGQVGFRLKVDSLLAGETVVELQFGGEEMVRFMVPTFADSLMSPITTRNLVGYQKLAGEIEHLVHFVMNEEPFVGTLPPGSPFGTL